MINDYCKTLPQYLLPKTAVSVLAGQLANVRNTRVKNWLIRRFIKTYQVNMQEAIYPDAEDYSCFNDFFIRHLQAEARPLSQARILSPVDGSISEIGPIEAGSILQAKGKSYTVNQLLANETMAPFFHQGRFITLYLSPKDYHRVHMPVDGRLLQTTYVPGKLFSVQPATVRVIPDLFCRNERLVAYFETPLGLMAMILVGATVVGAIGTSWGGEMIRCRQSQHIDYHDQNHSAQPNLPQGGEMGYFKLGSTVILVFADAQKVEWNKEVCAGQSIRFGQALMD